MKNIEDVGLEYKIKTDLFLGRIKNIVNSYLYQPTPGSQAIQEKTNLADPDLISDVLAWASICFESAGDHLMGFRDSFVTSIKSLSPFTCIRSLMESCSLAFWLLDTSISTQERISRVFSIRLKEIQEQIKFMNLDKHEPQISSLILDRENRILTIASEADKEGLPVKYNALGKVSMIGVPFPTIVELVRYSLNREQDYRLLSGVAHSYFWATHLFGFERVDKLENNKRLVGFKKAIKPERIIYGIDIAIPAISKVFWEMSKYLGWDMKEVEQVMELNYDEFNFKPYLKFWKTP